MPRRPIGPTSIKWCFTLNNPLDCDKEALFSLEEDKLKYAVWQLEIAPTTGTPHIQGYVILSGHAKPLNYMCRMFQANWLIARGSTESNITYCTKPGATAGPWEYGEKPTGGQGKRNDLLEVQKKLDKRMPMETIAQEHFSSFVRYNRGFNLYAQLISEPRNFKTQVIVLIGPTGCGKSWWAERNTNNGWPMFSGQWFDGYNGYDDIIINDFTGGMPYRQLLQLTDCTKWTLETKGGTVNIRPRRVVFTSNLRLHSWYNFEPGHTRGVLAALERRVDYHWDASDDAEDNKYYFDQEWTNRQTITNPYPIEEEEEVEIWSDSALEVTDLPDPLAPIDFGQQPCLPDLCMSQASTWDIEDEGHTLSSPFWDRELAELDDPHAKPISGMEFFCDEALDAALDNAQCSD